MSLIDVTGTIPMAKTNFDGCVTVYRWYPMSDVTFLQRISNILHRARVDGGWDDEDVARKVLEAIREPTDAMVEKADDLTDHGDWGSTPDVPASHTIAWRTMIDAALAEVSKHTSSEIGHG